MNFLPLELFDGKENSNGNKNFNVNDTGLPTEGLVGTFVIKTDQP